MAEVTYVGNPSSRTAEVELGQPGIMRSYGVATLHKLSFLVC